MSGRNLQDYIEVKDRIAEFWKRHPEGRVLTRVVEYSTERVLLFAEVYTDRDDARPVATGYAEEVRSDRGVNATSAVENGETSAIGRALANMGMTLSKNRASREEMQKVERHEQQTTPRAGSAGPGREAPAPRGTPRRPPHPTGRRRSPAPPAPPRRARRRRRNWRSCRRPTSAGPSSGPGRGSGATATALRSTRRWAARLRA
jgi:hypothetical protein